MVVGCKGEMKRCEVVCVKLNAIPCVSQIFLYMYKRFFSTFYDFVLHMITKTFVSQLYKLSNYRYLLLSILFTNIIKNLI